MKKLTLIVVCCIFSLLACAGGEKKSIVIKTQIYCDHCLQCSSCKGNISKSIRKNNEGIKKVNIEPAKNTITVVYDDAKAKPEKIKEAVLAAGFHADDQSPSAEAV